MSTGSITTSGLGSGLDVDGMIEKLREVERRPIEILEAKSATYQAQLTAYDILQQSVSSFDTALGKLMDLSNYDAKSATSSSSNVASVTASKTADVGTIKLEVEKLAEEQKIVSAKGYDNVDKAVGTGTLKIKLGDYDPETNTFKQSKEVSINISSSNNTLAGIRDAINASDSGVRASIVNDGKGNRLVLTSKETGQANAFSISVSDDATDGLKELAFDPTAENNPNMTLLQTAQDAVFKLDGIDMVSSSNKIDSAIKGLSITLQETGSTRITVNQTTEGLESAITGFVDAYNELNTVLRESLKYDKDTDEAGALNGESAVRNFQERIKRALTSTIDNIAGGATSLTQIGISVQKDGSLSVDNEKLQAAIKDPSKNVAALFTSTGTTDDKRVQFVSASGSVTPGRHTYNIKRDADGNLTGTINGIAITANGNQVSAGGITLSVDEDVTEISGSMTFTNGVIAQLRNVIDNETGENGGITRRVDSLNKMIEDIDEQGATLETRINARLDRMRTQYNNLDIYLAKMNSISEFLSQNLGNNKSEK